MFLLYRATGDVKWREHGWQIWEAIESKTRTASAYATVFGVDAVNPPRDNSLPRYVLPSILPFPEYLLARDLHSYFLAETVKYAYLITLDTDPWPAEKFILNTEAHPLPVFTWGDRQRRRVGI
jgi:mannosyl-oligosaccharide alpha-1,2-mannosidase